jgi:hypothetical protein
MALNGLVAANNLSDAVDSEQVWDNIGDTISATIPIPSPTLDLNFATNKNLIDNVSGNNLITYSRASSGTFIGTNGLIQTAASGVPRFTHDPITKESLGLLPEEARTNFCLRSEQFDDAVWEKYQANITANATTAPDGTITADSLIENTASADFHFTTQAISIVPNRIHTATVYAKANTRSAIRFGFVNSSYAIGAFAHFNVSTGVISNQQAISGSTDAAYAIEAVGAGWYRCSVTCLIDSSSTIGKIFVTLINLSAPDNLVYDGDGTSGIYLWGAQLERSLSIRTDVPRPSSATSYIPTTGAAATRAAEVINISGSNFTSWYNQLEGTVFAEGLAGLTPGGMMWSLSPNIIFNPNTYVSYAPSVWSLVDIDNAFIFASNVAASEAAKTVATIKTNNSRLAVNGSLGQHMGGALSPAITTLYIGNADYTGSVPDATYHLNGPIQRFTYYPVRLTDVAIQGLSTYGPVSSFPYSMSIKGRDILALREVNKVSTRDFVFIKGLFSAVQPRITTASQYTASGVTLRNAAMLKIAPTTGGNYFFSNGLTLSGVSCQINGTNARSIATSPFSGSGATVPLLLAGLRPQANWRISEPMASGTVTAPETAIPIETSDFVLFIKAGQN